MIQVRAIGHATFETPDLERQVAYYTDVVGLTVAARDKDRVHLASKLGRLTLEFLRGSEARCVRIAFEVARDTDFAAAARTLADEGIKSEQRSDPAPGIGAVLAFDDPKGTEVELFREWTPLGVSPRVNGVGVLKLGHLAYAVHDPKAISDFYCRVLGFRVSDWIQDFFAFLRCGPDHHTINFVRGKDVAMHHIAFELKDWAHVQTACELFGQRDIPIIWGPGRHGAGHNIFTYHRNPDDQIVEMYTELDKMSDEALGYFDPRPWHKDRPQRPKVWEPEAARLRWGPLPTPDFMRSRQ